MTTQTHWVRKSGYGAQPTHKPSGPWCMLKVENYWGQHLTSHATLREILSLSQNPSDVTSTYNCINFVALLLGINGLIHMKHLTYVLACCEYRIVNNDHCWFLYYHNCISVQYKSEIFSIMNSFGKCSVLVVKVITFPFLCVWNLCCLHENRYYNFYIFCILISLY